MAVQSVECLILLVKSRAEVLSLGTGILTEVPRSLQAREGQYDIRRSRIFLHIMLLHHYIIKRGVSSVNAQL